MLTDLIRFEWRYHTRQISFFAATLIYAALGFTLPASGFGPDNVHINSPYSIGEGLGLVSLASVFAMAVFCASAIVRDREHQFEEIVFSTPVEKFPLLFGRFAGSFLAAFTAFSASAIGMLIALAMPWQDATRIGPIAIHHYLWALVVIVLPGMLFAGALLFALAALTRSMIASVVGAVAIYVFYFIAAALTNSPMMAGSTPNAGAGAAASLLDPFGLSAFFEQTRYWTPSDRDTRLITLTGMFLLNRVIWISAALGLWLITYRKFGVRRPQSPLSVREPQLAQAPERELRLAHDKAAIAIAALQKPSDWSAFIATTKLELRSFLTSIPFLLLTLLWIVFAIAEILADLTTGEYGTALYPVTGFMLGALQQPLALVATVVIVWYSAEIVWRERTIAMAEVINATPASNAVFVLSKWIALAAMAVVLLIGSLASAVIVQLMRGYVHIEPGVMLTFAFIAGAPLILFAAAAVLIQTLSPQKYAGMLLVVVAGVLIHRGDAFGLEHPLLRFGSAPPIEYSAMNGFGHYLKPFAWFMTLWMFAGALLLMIAAAKWRGRFRLNRFVAVLAIAAAAIAAFLFMNTDFESARATRDWRAAYEKKYIATATWPKPRIAAIATNVDLYPKERRYRVRGTYRLVSDRPLTRVLVAVRRDAHINALSLSNAKLIQHDVRFGMWTFDVPPNAPMALTFDLTYDNPRFDATDSDNTIVANGSLLFDRRAFPTLGFRNGYRLQNAAQRRKYGLPPIAEDVSEGGDDAVADDWSDFDATITTDADQIAVTSGRLIAQSARNGRRTFHYRADHPIHSLFAIASARYAVAKAPRVEVYFHPAHRENVARILNAASDSLRLFEQTFGPYPHDTLRIAEVPGYWKFGGFATPGLIAMVENRLFLIDARDPRRLDLVTRRTAHEIAHQWFGHTVTAATAPGASTIVESLTKYAELLVLERKYGRDVVRESLTRELDLYLAGRADDRNEPPLSRVTDQSYIYYRKGAIVMYALRDLLGEETFHRALRTFIAEKRSATFPDLLRHLHAVATPRQRVLIDQWLTDVVVYDLRMTSAAALQLANGQYQVTMTVFAHKSKGAFDESIEIAVDDAISRHVLHEGANVIAMTVAKKPQVAIVDPFITRVDRDRFDNERKF